MQMTCQRTNSGADVDVNRPMPSGTVGTAAAPTFARSFFNSTLCHCHTLITLTLILVLVFTLHPTHTHAADGIDTVTDGVNAQAAAATTPSDSDFSTPSPSPSPTDPTSAASMTLFNLDIYSSSHQALHAYATWHNETLANQHLCKNVPILVWTATAGFGDSVNALTTAFRYALASGRLFFIEWSSGQHRQMWKAGLQQPGFMWDYDDAIKHAPHCQFSYSALHHESAMYKSRDRQDGENPPRFVSLRGSITSGHVLSGLLHSPRFHSYRHVLHSLQDGLLQDFLLKPSAIIRPALRAVARVLRRRSGHGHKASNKIKPKDVTVTVVGMQIRTGAADGKDPTHRPTNANFLNLQQGDDKLFVDKFEQLFERQKRRMGPGPPDPDPNRVLRVFLMSDSAEVRDQLKEEIETRFEEVRVVQVDDEDVRRVMEKDRQIAAALAMAQAMDADEVINAEHYLHDPTSTSESHPSASDSDPSSTLTSTSLSASSRLLGPVAHCGPSASPSLASIRRLLVEWFTFRRQVDVALLTAWSLFGSSAVEGSKRVKEVHRIDASDCGKKGAKPCQNDYA